eukprot:TRINITY_DN15041_c0_g1_i1.p1 TRINITY_DN15041_c0_g1~~TRINITY_DN15041_c0_g1_i1.p1  ORF type:complete len:123 (-),score=13.10 TRINITY_DN15041_c0_g1_i1:209-577(-)
MAHQTPARYTATSKSVGTTDEFEDPEEEMEDQSRLTNSPLRKYAKTAGVAICLVVLGVSFLIAAIVDISIGEKPIRAVSFLVVGILCALPGAYQSWVLFQAYRRAPGYRFSQVPSYDSNAFD